MATGGDLDNDDRFPDALAWLESCAAESFGTSSSERSSCAVKIITTFCPTNPQTPYCVAVDGRLVLCREIPDPLAGETMVYRETIDDGKTTSGAELHVPFDQESLYQVVTIYLDRMTTHVIQVYVPAVRSAVRTEWFASDDADIVVQIDRYSTCSEPDKADLLVSRKVGFGRKSYRVRISKHVFGSMRFI